jgi:hypothetical protein
MCAGSRVGTYHTIFPDSSSFLDGNLVGDKSHFKLMGKDDYDIVIHILVFIHGSWLLAH